MSEKNLHDEMFNTRATEAPGTDSFHIENERMKHIQDARTNLKAIQDDLDRTNVVANVLEKVLTGDDDEKQAVWDAALTIGEARATADVIDQALVLISHDPTSEKEIDNLSGVLSLVALILVSRILSKNKPEQ